MARDFERGRRTELEALTGTLVRLGEARGVDGPRRADGLRHLQTAATTRVPAG